MLSFLRRTKPATYGTPSSEETLAPNVRSAIDALVSSAGNRKILVLSQDSAVLARRVSPLFETFASCRAAGWAVVGYEMLCESGLGLAGYPQGEYSEVWRSFGSFPTNVAEKCAREGKRLVFLPDFDSVLGQRPDSPAASDIRTILEYPFDGAVVAAHTGSSAISDFDYVQFDTLVMSSSDRAFLAERFETVLDPALLSQINQAPGSRREHELIIAHR